MSNYLFILGNNNALSVAELFIRFPKNQFEVIGPDWVLMNLSVELDQKDLDSLGGTIKIGKVLQEVEMNDVVSGLASVLADKAGNRKLDYGVSVYGMPERNLRSLLLDLKKMLKKGEVKSRFINNQFQNITAAQYKSIRRNGVEYLVAQNSGRYWIAETVGVQNIDAYSLRDYGKPFRDMKMGMLPPKLAQILINLTGVPGTIWDPFCGSGALVMEGLLMGHSMIGSDIHAGRVEGAKQNVEWLKNEFGIRAKADLFPHDATKPFTFSFDAIAAETDLGAPHSLYIRSDQLQKIMMDLDQLYVRFFENLKRLKCNKPVVVALPFFRLSDGEQKDMERTIQSIERLGFKRTALLPELFKSADRFCLKYSRLDQAVGRAIYRFVFSN